MPDEERADRVIQGIRQYLAEVDEWLAPNRLPDDYRFFIEYYGGLHINNPSHYFDIFGYGLGATTEYEIPMGGYESLYENGWLAIGMLSLKDEEQAHYGHFVHFFIDLAGSIHQGCVIAIPTWGLYESIRDLRIILRDTQAHKDCWTRVADSFTTWLEIGAETHGTFGFIRSQTMS